MAPTTEKLWLFIQSLSHKGKLMAVEIYFEIFAPQNQNTWQIHLVGQSGLTRRTFVFIVVFRITILLSCGGLFVPGEK